MKKLTREWLRKAESDLRVAKVLAKTKPLPSDEICFHCQQAAEKFLKALLQESGVRVPRTHNLTYLLGLLIAHQALQRLKARLGRMTRYAVDYRYPGIHASSANARSALRYAEQARTTVRQALGLRPKRDK